MSHYADSPNQLKTNLALEIICNFQKVSHWLNYCAHTLYKLVLFPTIGSLYHKILAVQFTSFLTVDFNILCERTTGITNLCEMMVFIHEHPIDFNGMLQNHNQGSNMYKDLVFLILWQIIKMLVSLYNARKTIKFIFILTIEVSLLTILFTRYVIAKKI